MSFEDKIYEYSKNMTEKLQHIENEETTKTALILPFLNVMGYDTTNPAEVKTEYTADLGAKQGEKVDVAIVSDNQVNILIECKSLKTTLDETHISQLYRYFNITDSKIAILTNVLIYNFYTDSQKDGLMDQTPFFKFDLTNITDNSINILEKFTKERFDIDNIMSRVDDLKYAHDIHEVIYDEINSPSEEFIKVIAKQVYDGILTKNMKDKFYVIIKKEFKNVINDEVEYKLNQALQNTKETEEEEIISTSDDVITTDEEIEGFYIVKSILGEIVDINRLTFRDYKSYSVVLLDNNKYYPICRFYFNDNNRLKLGFFDSFEKHDGGTKKVEIVHIQNLKEIYLYKDKFIKTVTHYKRIKNRLISNS